MIYPIFPKIMSIELVGQAEQVVKELPIPSLAAKKDPLVYFGSFQDLRMIQDGN
jgi:hypothetical protein